MCDLIVLMDEVRRGIPPIPSVLCNLRDRCSDSRHLHILGPLGDVVQRLRPNKHTYINTQKYLSLQSLPVIVEEAEAVEFVLWRSVVGMTAPAARLMSGFRPGGWSLNQNKHTH